VLLTNQNKSSFKRSNVIDLISDSDGSPINFNLNEEIKCLQLFLEEIIRLLLEKEEKL